MACKAYISAGSGLQTGKSQNWKYEKKTKKKTTIYREYLLLCFINSIFRKFIRLPKKNRKTKRKSKFEKRFRIPILLGGNFFLMNKDWVILELNIYYDFLKCTQYERKRLRYLLLRSLFGLKFYFNSNICILTKNLFLFFYRYLGQYLDIYHDNVLLHTYFNKKQILMKQKIVRILLIQFELHWFLKNRFFDRVFCIFITGFFFFDSLLIAKSLSQELKNLRKLHRKFIRMIKQLSYFSFSMTSFNFFYLNSEKKNDFSLLEGFQIFFKGKLTLGTRRMKRKIKILLRIGKMDYDNCQTNYYYGDSIAATRFGVVNTKVWFNAKSQKKNFFFSPNFFLHKSKSIEDDWLKSRSFYLFFLQLFKNITNSKKKIIFKKLKNILKRKKFKVTKKKFSFFFLSKKIIKKLFFLIFFDKKNFGKNFIKILYFLTSINFLKYRFFSFFKKKKEGILSYYNLNNK